MKAWVIHRIAPIEAAFLALAAGIPILPAVETYTLASANEALVALKHRRNRGAKELLV